MTKNAAQASPPGAPASLAQQLGAVVVSPRRDLVVTRQIVRGEPRYIVHDPVAFANHALEPLEYRILCSLGTRATLAETLAGFVSQRVLGEEDADEFYEFILWLHGLGLLVVPGMPADLAWRRRQERLQKGRKSKINWLVSLRWSLGDPDRWLDRLLPYTRWLFRLPGIALWLLLLLLASWHCGGRLGEIYGSAGDLLALHNLPVVWLSIVVLKVLHELGHGIALKRYGGKVPDFGVLFVFMTPCAYIDANASWTFTNRWQRIVVALGGMYVETMIAFVFAMIWAGTPPGLLHSTAQTVVVLATVTTLLININPLIKFDGYYVFSDLMGVYNLAERAKANMARFCERWFLGMPAAERQHSRTESLLYWLYAPSSLLYRVSLAFGVTALMMTSWPALGVPLGLAFAWLLIVGPVVRLSKQLWSGERLEAVRLRARIVAVLTLLVSVVVGFSVSISRSIVVPGVLDPGIKRSVRAPSSSFIETLDVKDGDVVARGAGLCRLHNPQLEERLLDLASELRTMRVRLDATEVADPNAAATSATRIEFLERRLFELRQQQQQLDVVCAESGTVVGANAVTPGGYVREGHELMQVHSQHSFVRVVLDDREVARARLEIGSRAKLRWVSAPGETVLATVCETRRSASRRSVPAELTIAAGGAVVVHDVGGQFEADRPYVHVFLRLDGDQPASAASGMTAQVRFAARELTLGSWVRQSLLDFFYNWRLT